MLGLCLEVQTKCGGCGQPVPVNAFTTVTACSHCDKPVPLPIDLWSSIVADVISEAPEFEEREGRESQILSGKRTVAMTYGRRLPRCEACKGEFELAWALAQAARHGGEFACPKCARAILVRSPPEEAAPLLPGVTHLLGEDPDQARGVPAGTSKLGGREPLRIHCPECGAGQALDGTSRSFQCGYCHKTSVLPDEIWRTLHPVREVVRWYLVYDAAAARLAQRDKPVQWEGLDDVVVDPQGIFYCAGEIAVGDADGKYAIWAMGPDFKLRWRRDDLPFDDDSSTRLRVAPDGTLAIWSKKKHGLWKIRCDDGTDVTKLGGKEPQGATAHGLDLDGCEDLVIDADGSIVAAIHDRIVRWTPTGEPTTTWPPPTGIFGFLKKEKLQPLWRVDSDGDRRRVEGDYDRENVLDDRLLFASDSDVSFALGWDGTLCMAFDDKENGGLVRYDRDGHVRVRTRFSELAAYHGHQGGRLTLDGAGNAYLRVYTGSSTYELWRISPDGKDVTSLAKDTRAGGTFCADEDLVVASPDGVVWTFGTYGQVRAFKADGSLALISDKSRESDADDARERTRKQAADED